MSDAALLAATTMKQLEKALAAGAAVDAIDALELLLEVGHGRLEVFFMAIRRGVAVAATLASELWPARHGELDAGLERDGILATPSTVYEHVITEELARDPGGPQLEHHAIR